MPSRHTCVHRRPVRVTLPRPVAGAPLSKLRRRKLAVE